MSAPRDIDEALIRRVEAAISAAVVRRSAVEFDWPECHKAKCAGRHGNVDTAFGTMKLAIMQTVRSELMHEMTTRPDIAGPEDTAEQAAVYALAALLHTYNVNRTSTYVQAAQLIVDAYPDISPALAGDVVESNRRAIETELNHPLEAKS
jgi:hypothetical protein